MQVCTLYAKESVSEMHFEDWVTGYSTAQRVQGPKKYVLKFLDFYKYVYRTL